MAKITLPGAPSLQNRALLVSIGISQWDARRIDKAETAAVQLKHSTSSKAARVHKSLLPGSKELESIHKLSGDIRTFVYKHTLPWGEGVQILRTVGYLQFTSDLDVLRNKWEQAVNDFIYEYPNLVLKARHSLGGLYNPEDYPEQAKLRERFKIDAKYMPVPEANDWRVDLDDEHISSLRESVERQLKESQQAAMSEVWSRLYKVVEHAHERLSNPKAIFRDSLIENAVELCALLPSLNLTNDPKLEQLRKQVERSLCAHDPKTLRKSSNDRQKTAQDLAKVMSKMSAMYGGGAFNAS